MIPWTQEICELKNIFWGVKYKQWGRYWLDNFEEKHFFSLQDF